MCDIVENNFDIKIVTLIKSSTHFNRTKIMRKCLDRKIIRSKFATFHLSSQNYCRAVEYPIKKVMELKLKSI